MLKIERTAKGDVVFKLTGRMGAENVNELDITAHGDTIPLMQVLRGGATECLTKPLKNEVLLFNVRAASEG